MAEVEVHGGHGHGAAHAHGAPTDPFGRAVGVAVAVIGIVLAVATIAAHRAHTAAIITRTQVNDDWAFYQAKKQREHLLEVGAALAETLGDPARARPLAEKFRGQRERYVREAEVLQQQAREREAETAHEETRALRLDLSEGFLELGLVLSSLYFLSKRRFFPLLGALAALLGAAFTLWGLIT
ncbi:MAG: DUF4337 family protein [Gammaproteobacteria bacterium]|nr:DUF4337 family protein [Gammaproteobacteria bacterium]